MTSLALCALARDITQGDLPLTETIEQLIPFVDEVIVGVSTQSTDNSLGILQDQLAGYSQRTHVYAFDWPDDFSAALNTLFDHSTADWNLRMDQDRRLNVQHLRQFRDLIDSDPEEHVLLFRETDYDTGELRAHWQTVLRGSLRYSGIIYEHAVKTPEVNTGRIVDHCVAPDEMLRTGFECLHSESGRRADESAYRSEMMQREWDRIEAAVSSARTAADFYKLASATFGLGLHVQRPEDDLWVGWIDAYRHFLECALREPDNPAPLIGAGDVCCITRRPKEASEAYKVAERLGSHVAVRRLEVVRRYTSRA